MKYLAEYRDRDKIEKVRNQISRLDSREMKIMEVCGTQTHTIMKYALEELLPPNITMIHGPGCPVCVTSAEIIDKAVSLALMENTVVAAYGDMMRVPGSKKSLMEAKAEGAGVYIIYSPLDAVHLAQNNKEKNIILFAIGFETTAPANASALLRAHYLNLKNFYLLSAQVLIPPAVELIMNSENIKVDGLLAPGHVCTITGYNWCEQISFKYNVPIAVTGFEPLDILEGIYFTAEAISSAHAGVTNQYRRVVKKEGNIEAQKIISKVFKTTGRDWRGLGFIEGSALDLRDEYEMYDAVKVFNPFSEKYKSETKCIAGDILKGIKKPDDCPLFGKDCRPLYPYGAPMVSSEGVCAAYYNYRLNSGEEDID